MKEQMCVRAPIVSRRVIAAGRLAAGALGELQVRRKNFKRAVCEKHVWREGKWFYRCVECGKVEDFGSGVVPRRSEEPKVVPVFNYIPVIL